MMKRRMIGWMIFFLMVLLALPVLLGISAFLLPKQYGETYLGEFREKRERLQEVQGEKIVVVGGSSVAFGIRSDLMEEELEMPVVNWGLYAPLGSRTMLEACLDEIGEGDVVIFSPEQNEETLSLTFQPEEVWQAMDGDYSLLKIFDEEGLKQLQGAFPGYAVSRLKYALRGKPEVSGIYRKDSFNEYGDIDSDMRSGNRMTDGYDLTQMIDLSFFPDQEFLDYLNDYSSRVREKGAEFYYRFCPMNEQAVLNEELLDDWFLRLDEAAEFTILGDPHRSVMESGWFYDTNFHLNESGAVVNTYYFVRDIKAEWKDSSPTDILLPEMPEPVDVGTMDAGTERDEQEENRQQGSVQEGHLSDGDTAEGDNADADCFLYEEDDGNLIITGVSEEREDREELTVPIAYEGRKVTALTEGSLASCKNLRTLYIQGGMTLYDGCFDGCERLERIVLLAEPSEITAGRNLLRGCDALLYTEYPDEYRLDYSWGLYSDKIREYND